MTYEECKEIFRDTLQERLGTVATVSLVERVMADDTLEDGIEVKDAKGNSSVIGMGNFYRADITMEEVFYAVERTLEHIRENLKIQEQACTIMQKWEFCWDRVFPVLLSKKKAPEELVQEEYLDFIVVYIVRMDDGILGFSAKITKGLADFWKVSEEEIKKAAFRNMDKEKFFLMDIFDTLCPHSTSNCISEMSEDALMYVLRNQTSRYGAAALLHKELLRKVSGRKNFYIIPSSLHELILIPDIGDMEAEHLNRMIHEVNILCVNESDRLGENCLYYDYQTDEIRSCA